MTDPTRAGGADPGAGRDPARDPDRVTADLDVVQPFQLDRSSLRGRLVRLGPALDEILTRHAYPDPVALLLGETITLGAALASALKYEGIFTLQTKGDGPVSFTVADVTSVGDLRGYASFDADRLAAAVAAGAPGTLRDMLGTGYLAFTVDQGEHTERYQGIVELAGDSLDDAVRHYFRQSEQLATGIKVAVGRDSAGRWVGGAILVQALPEEGGARGEAARHSDVEEDDWRRAMVLLGSCTEAELLDARLPVNDLLFRLFHEEGARVYTRHALRAACRCSRGRVATALRSIPRGELEDLKVDGRVAVTCEFCKTEYGFDDAALDAVYAD
ncbi:Hsp33 family molecular chaperone HslO [Rhodospirillum centenum]|uniref:Hsp33 protein, putative n=1 Tax=Rhodospirillum centenum (strain ATCC 51521 / SW) TaxID=414684 RepID=B6IUN2_RHOCS|nr:Hsp33 family molecular chaperone HslO [Rhodospirillum centenum]ACI99857.1 Hsp33 protein, putative [Rhodospirillum centenum SW]